MGGPAVSEVQERPQRRRMGKGAAKREHARKGFSSYRGPKLKGPRFVLTTWSPEYPTALRHIPRPPACLYGIGDPAALQEGLAVVGARKATPYGLDCCRLFAGIAASRGIAIISGGARGCDSEAHRAALRAHAPTVAFLGGGCDQIYPAQNYELFQAIVDSGGAVVSEQEWDYPCMPYLFLERNRLIAGLAKATLIVEAGLPSGTFSTADAALDAAKEVLVVPGAITSASSRGTNRLLCQGATPVVDKDTFEAALDDLFGSPWRKGAAPEERSDACERKADGRIDAEAEVAARGRARCVSGCEDEREQARGADDEGKQDADEPGRQGGTAKACTVGRDDEERDEDLLLAAIGARPTSMDELCALARCFPGEFDSALAWCASVMEKYERAGKAVRLPDGRYAARVGAD